MSDDELRQAIHAVTASVMRSIDGLQARRDYGPYRIRLPPCLWAVALSEYYLGAGYYRSLQRRLLQVEGVLSVEPGDGPDIDVRPDGKIGSSQTVR